MLLVADIGGTRSRFYAIEGENIVFSKIYASKEAPNFEAVLKNWLSDSGLTFETAIIGLAGAIQNGHCKTTNLPWEVQEKKILETLGVKKVYLLNDLELLSYGVLSVDEKNLKVIQEGDKQQGPILVVCPGTGLGVSCVLQTKPFIKTLATEAGHMDYSPSNVLEIEILEYFLKSLEHVSIERIASGSGLLNLYDFVTQKQNHKKIFTQAEEITENATFYHDPVCVETCKLFWQLLAKACGNFALAYLPYQGIYLCGSLIKKIAPFFDAKVFCKRMGNKGRFASLLSKIPVYWVDETELATRGAINFFKQEGR